jgi:hypothetical protein
VTSAEIERPAAGVFARATDPKPPDAAQQTYRLKAFHAERGRCYAAPPDVTAGTVSGR